MKARFFLVLAPALAAACSDSTTTSDTGQGGDPSGVPTATTAATGTGGAGGSDSSSITASTTSSSTTTSSTTGAGGSSPVECIVGANTGLVLAVNELLLGDKNPDGASDVANAWKKYGFDVDGLTSTAASSDLCMPVGGASVNTVYVDGEGGKDNSFGKNLLPIFLGLAPDFSDIANQSITDGDSTLLLRLADLGAGASQNTVDAKLYSGAQTSEPPTFDGSFCWPVSPDSLSDPSDIESAKAAFPASALADQVWTSNLGGTVTIRLVAAGSPIALRLHQARLSLRLDAAHEAASEGQIGGVLDTEELVEDLRQVVGSFDPSLCSGATFESIADQIRQAQDILLDGTQDPTKSCSGISIGLGFKMAKAGLGTIAPVVDPGPKPCP